MHRNACSTRPINADQVADQYDQSQMTPTGGERAIPAICE